MNWLLYTKATAAEAGFGGKRLELFRFATAGKRSKTARAASHPSQRRVSTAAGGAATLRPLPPRRMSRQTRLSVAGSPRIIPPRDR